MELYDFVRFPPNYVVNISKKNLPFMWFMFSQVLQKMFMYSHRSWPQQHKIIYKRVTHGRKDIRHFAKTVRKSLLKTRSHIWLTLLYLFKMRQPVYCWSFCTAIASWKFLFDASLYNNRFSYSLTKQVNLNTYCRSIWTFSKYEIPLAIC